MAFISLSLYLCILYLCIRSDAVALAPRASSMMDDCALFRRLAITIYYYVCDVLRCRRRPVQYLI